MYYFDLPFFQLNRRMLVIFGQWPYQKLSTRVTTWILYSIIVGSGIFLEVRRALIQEYIDFDLWVELITLALSSIVMMIRYFAFAVYSSNIKRLLDEMIEHWQSLTNFNDQDIFCAYVEGSTLFVGRYAHFAFVMALAFTVTTISTPLLIYTPYFNESCPLLMMYEQGYILDPQKYCLIFLIHIILIVVLLSLSVIATDTMYMVIMFHCVGLFKVACYRLEHAFDDCSGEKQYAIARTSTCQRIAGAVNLHRTAIRFADGIKNTFSLSNLISILLNMLNVAISLYWATRSQQSTLKMMFPLVMAGAFITHLFFLDLPSQRMMDNSEAIIFKAYCGRWYMARPKEQILLLLAMQRGLNPTSMVMGKVYRATLENFASEVQASFSYFTLLLSMK